MFFKKLMDILALDLQSVHYEKRELILDAINQVTWNLTNWYQFFVCLSCYRSWILHNIVKVAVHVDLRGDSQAIQRLLWQCYEEIHGQ